MRHDGPALRSWLRLVWAALVVLVVTGSLLPGSSRVMRALNRLDLNDKFEHFAAYGGLGFLPTLREAAARLRFVLPAVALMGVLLEFGQLYSPGRTYDTRDMLADLAGVTVGFLVALQLRTSIKA